MSKQDQIKALQVLAMKRATDEQNTKPTTEDRSRYTYAACATFRNLFNKRPSQAVIDAVRFETVWG